MTGADKVMKIAEAYHAKVAILKEGSPSCGVRRVHDGSFSGKYVKGPGVAAALLTKAGLKIYSEKDMTIGRLEELLAEDMKDERS